jgi:hypothetical protein
VHLNRKETICLVPSIEEKFKESTARALTKSFNNKLESLAVNIFYFLNIEYFISCIIFLLIIYMNIYDNQF